MKTRQEVKPAFRFDSFLCRFLYRAEEPRLGQRLSNLSDHWFGSEHGGSLSIRAGRDLAPRIVRGIVEADPGLVML
jgi:hypothetical protein